MKVTIGYTDPSNQKIVEDLLKGFTSGAVDLSAVDGAAYIHGIIRDVEKPYLEQAFTDTNSRFAGSNMTLAFGN